MRYLVDMVDIWSKAVQNANSSFSECAITKMNPPLDFNVV